MSLVLGVDKMAPEHTQVTGKRFLSSGRGAWRPAWVSVAEQWLNRRMGLAESPPTWAEGSGWMRTERGVAQGRKQAAALRSAWDFPIVLHGPKGAAVLRC